MSNEDYQSIPNGLSSISKKDVVTTITTTMTGLPHHHHHDPFFVTTAPLDSIGELEMKRAFEQIATCIHLDDDEYALPHDRTVVPDLDSPISATSTIIPFSTPNSSPSHRINQIDQVLISTDFGLAPSLSLSPSRRMQRSYDPPITSSPVPMSTKSFLDADWLTERVKHDPRMAQVAGGLVRSSSTPPHTTITNNGEAYYDGTLGQHAPPKDYTCKLCNIPGHWLKDCHLYEPRGGGTSTGFAHTRTSSMSSHLISRHIQPPGNYVCRLCRVPGHWIEQCSKFQPKLGRPEGGFKGIPPKNYICNLCHTPGHWIQQCSEFTPMPGHKRSLSSERNRFF